MKINLPVPLPYLLLLRAHFRAQFQQHDFCIGEQEIERVFAELIDEAIEKGENEGDHLLRERKDRDSAN